MRISFSLILFVFSTHSFCQTKLSGQIFDSLTMKPIPYVHVLFDIGGGVASDQNGFFKISEAKTINELKFSALAYEEILIKNWKASENLQIFLKAKTFQMDEVAIRPNDTEIFMLNPYQKRKTNHWFCHETVGSEWVHYFPVDDANAKIYLYSFFLFFKRIKSNRKIRIRVYAADENRKPAESLLHQSVFFELNKKKGWEEIILTQYNIKLPKDGFFVGIEFLPIKSKDEKIVCFGLSSKNTNTNTWIKLIGGEWFKEISLRDNKNRIENLMTRVKLERIIE